MFFFLILGKSLKKYSLQSKRNFGSIFRKTPPFFTNQEIVSIKKIINPVKAIIIPRNRGINDRNTLDIERSVPIIKQAIAKIALNAASSLIFFQDINPNFLYLNINYMCNKKFH